VNNVGVIFVLSVVLVILTILVMMLLALKRRISGVSKDYAQQIVMRRFGQGQVIGARFTRVGNKWIWEFDVRDRETIRRIWVDARAASVVKAVALSPSERYSRHPGPALGRRIGK
jgi:hypothetical protein